MAFCPSPAPWTQDLGIQDQPTHELRMMMRVPFRAPPRIPSLADDAARWFAPFLVALMVYLASLAGIGLILVDQTLYASQDALAGRLTVQVPAEASAARLQTMLAVLR